MMLVRCTYRLPIRVVLTSAVMALPSHLAWSSGWHPGAEMGLSILLSFRSLTSRHQIQSVKRVVPPNPKSAKSFYIFLLKVFTDKSSARWKHMPLNIVLNG